MGEGDKAICNPDTESPLLAAEAAGSALCRDNWTRSLALPVLQEQGSVSSVAALGQLSVTHWLSQEAVMKDTRLGVERR